MTLPEVEIERQQAPPPYGESTEPSRAGDLDRSTLEDASGVTDLLQKPGDVLEQREISKHLQDAPPLAGASQGTESSRTSSPPKLIPISEVELQRKAASPAEEDLTQTAGQTEGLLAAVGRDEHESEEEILEVEDNREHGQEEPISEKIPKNRRTYCRKASCITCKAQCGNCPDCASSNTKTCCRERPQCPDKKPRELRPGKGNPQTLNPSSMPVDSGEAKDRGRTMLRRSKSMCGGTPVSIPDIFRAPEDSVMTKKRKQGGNSEDDNKRRNTSCDVEPEDGRARRNSLAEPMSTSSTIIQMRRTSGLPIFNTKSKAGEAAPQGVVFGRDP